MKLRPAQIFLALLGLCGVTLSAQVPFEFEREPQGLERDFLLRVWETADGLLPTHVRGIAQTRDGYVWLAAFDGFVRFDGTRAAVISGKSVQGLPDLPKASRVFADAGGRLWGATSEGRVFSHDAQSWRGYGPEEGWPGLVVEGIAENADGRLIFSGAKSVLEWSAGRFSPVVLPELPRDFRPPFRAVFDGGGRLWLRSPSHVWREESGGWKLIAAAEPKAGAFFQGAAPARDGGMWIATARELRKYVDDAPVVTHERPEGFRNDPLEMLEDFHGNLWAGGGNSGLRIWMKDGRVVAASASAETLPSQITCLFEDRERNVLVGTAGAGLARYKPRPFQVWFGRLGGLAGTIVNAICEEAPGRILIGTEGSGLRRISRDQPPALIVSADGALGPKHRVTSLLRTRDGVVLVAVSGRGLFRVEGEQAVALPEESLAHEHIRAMFEDSRGRLWIGSERGLTLREGGVFKSLGGLRDVRAIAEGRDGVLWFIGQQGLGRLAGAEVEIVPLTSPAKGAKLLSLFGDRAGALWVGVESKGLLRIQDGREFLFTVDHGLPVVSPGAILEEGEHLWMSGEKGIVRFSRAALDAVAAGHSARLELQLFNRADGLPSDACRRGYQPAAAIAADGQLWFATHKGAVSVRPAELTSAAFEPPALIEEIRAETTLFLITRENRDRIDIPAGTRHMSIRCAIPSLGKPEYARFQYRLGGFDERWREAGGERVIRFYDLAPGSYRFEVRAVGTDGRFVEPPTSVTMAVHPLIWQRPLLQMLAVASLIGLVAFVVWRIQQARLRRQQEKLREQEARARLESQLQQSQKMEAIGRLAGGIAHDFNNLLTSVSGNAELLQIELPPSGQSHAIVGDIATAAGRARELVSQILTFSRQRSVERRALDPAPVLREAWQLLRAGLPAMVEVRTEIPATLPAVLADAAQLQRIIMNLGTNAAQAIGSAGRILLRAEECTAEEPPAVPLGRYLRLTVEDDGPGMDAQTLQRIYDPFFTTKEVGQGTGLGLSVVHGIVEAHEGFITVESRPQAGTTFRIYLPFTTQPLAPVAPPGNTQSSSSLRRIARESSAGEEFPAPSFSAAVSSTAPLSPPVLSSPIATLESSSSAAAGEAVLLVDDEDIVRKITVSMLEKLGYVVESSADPAAALEMLLRRPERFRLVITDFAMPGFDGVELARRVWEQTPGFPIILYSGYGGRLTPDEAVRMGFVRLLPKPFRMSELEEAVEEAWKVSLTKKA